MLTIDAYKRSSSHSREGQRCVEFLLGEHFTTPWLDGGGTALSGLRLLEMVRRNEVYCFDHQAYLLTPYLNFVASGLQARPEIEEGLYVMSALLECGARISERTLPEVERVIGKLTEQEIDALVGDDRWLRNFLLNIWEFANGVDVLKSYPWNISLPIADICNARCIFCTSWIEGKSLVKLSQIEAFAEVVANSIYIGLVGHGEPMAHPQFDKICEIIERHMDPRATAYTITNGVFLKKWGDLLDRINLRSVSISLNAATAATHNEVMGLGEEAFPEIVEGIRSLTSKGLSEKDRMVSITMVVTQQNIHEIPAFIALGEELGVNQVWLRSLLPQARLTPGLNYHVLPPTLHPNYAELRRRAVGAILKARVAVQADPSLWDQEVFSPALKEEIHRSPPAMVMRDEVLKDKALRGQKNELYKADANKLRGMPIGDANFTRVYYQDGRASIETRAVPWSYALRYRVATPEGSTGTGRIVIGISNVEGAMGFGLLDTKANEWIARSIVDTPGEHEVSLEFDVSQQGVELIVHNGSGESISSACTISAPRLAIDAAAGGTWVEIPLMSGTVDAPADELDDGANPFGRRPRFACKAPYYNLYINEMYYRLVPCCFMQKTPGYDEIRFDGSQPFMEAWNAPSMVELRRRLRDGPLFGACRKCPEKW